MNVYWLIPAVDNPMFEGLATDHHAPQLNNWPTDWCRHFETWEAPRLIDTWRPLPVVGRVQPFNDYPCINMTSPAFSQRAVDLLKRMLEQNGELLPVYHPTGTYYYYNCTRVLNCLDLERSAVTRTPGGVVSRKERLIFIEEMLLAESVFRIRTQPPDLFCTQVFVDRVAAASLQGFVFVKVWPFQNGETFFDELYRATMLSRKWRPRGESAVDVKGNTVVLRLFCDRKRPTKIDKEAANAIMEMFDRKLVSVASSSSEYVGSLEGHDILDHEIRVYLSSPDCDRLVALLMPYLRELPWLGKFQIAKHRNEMFAGATSEEYVIVD